MPKCVYFRDRFLTRAKDCLTNHMFKNAVNIEATVFSRELPVTNQFQVLFTSFTFLFKLYSHLFKLYYHLFSSCYLQVVIYKLVHVVLYLQAVKMTSSSCINTFGNDVSACSEMT